MEKGLADHDDKTIFNLEASIIGDNEGHAVMKAVILAAGRGERLTPYTDVTPKPLIRVQGKPIIEYVIGTLNEVGVKECLLVTGYKGELIRSHIQELELSNDVTFIHNPDYTQGNGSTFLCAKKALKGESSFLLCMSDHIVEASLIENAIKQYQGENLLCIDKTPQYLRDLADATKVQINDKGYVRYIGKELCEWNGVDTGVFLLKPEIFNLFPRKMANPITLSDCMKKAIKESALKICDVSGKFWFDIDTEEDLIHAQRLMKEWTK